MKLKSIIEKMDCIKNIKGKLSLQIKGITSDSKAVREGYLFIAIKGSCFNGEDFINEAIDRGASGVVVESESNSVYALRRGPTFIYVNDARRALSQVSRTFYSDISSKMKLIGITGTNGKTTTSYLIEGLLKHRGEKTGVIGTINYRFGDRIIPAINTTPGVLDLYFLLSSMKKEHIRSCILEVSSHSLEQGRVDTLNFDIAIFTNLTSDHLDYHKNIDNYIASKVKLFTKIKDGGWAVINKDDPYSRRIVEKVNREHKATVISYGIDDKADVFAKDIEFSFEGLRFKLCVDKKYYLIRSCLIGRYNVYNILASAACGITMGMTLEEIALGLEKVKGLPGRLERIDCGQDFSVFIDYAHTKNGLENVLRTLKELGPKRVFTVFGCGGDRDKSKRPRMGKVAIEFSDKVFITSDNPRNEDPVSIINDITKGIACNKASYIVELDRSMAINKALSEAKSGDIVLVAGKGHETYQIFKDTTLPFDDREVVKKILKEKRLCLQSKIS